MPAWKPPAASYQSEQRDSEGLARPSQNPNLPNPNQTFSPPLLSSSFSTLPRPRALRSRTSTMTNTYTPPLPPVMSRENSVEQIPDHIRPATNIQIQIPHIRTDSREVDLSSPVDETGPFNFQAGSLHPHDQRRRASLSASPSLPTWTVTPSKQTYYTPQTHTTPSFTSPKLGTGNTMGSPEIGLKRRTSTPSLYKRFTRAEEEEPDEGLRGEYGLLDPSLSSQQQSQQDVSEKRQDIQSRGRSTSTSVVNAQTQNLTENSVYTLLDKSSSSLDPGMPGMPKGFRSVQPAPPQAWSEKPTLSPLPSPEAHVELSPVSEGVFAAAYRTAESSIYQLVDYVRPETFSHPSYDRRESEEDESEKGLNGSLIGSEDETEHTRPSEESLRKGKYWMVGSPEEADVVEGANGYLTLPATPPDNEKTFFSLPPNAVLPTPALSAKSLSRGDSNRNKLKKAFRRKHRHGIASEGDDCRNGWMAAVWSKGTGQSGGKMGEVLRELGWTVGALGASFFLTLGLVLWLIRGMPLTTLKHLPKSTTDVQLLSAEIRAYMASGSYGWWHTVGVLTLVGCWKHAWSVPGAVVLNILVGSVLEPIPALVLLTIITASGSLGAYCLSRPLAPLIAVIFPKPLALVRAALTPDSVPAPDAATPVPGETITPIHASSEADARPIGGPTEASSIWRRLLIMRAMGFVPWSGMNVACGVVGVDWKVFWLTTAAGSASWSYVTASVGNILSRLKVPTGTMTAAGDVVQGESLTGLLRDPVLIFKLVVLSGLTLLPVILKKNSSTASGPISGTPSSASSFTHPGLATPSTASLPVSIPYTLTEKPLIPAIQTLRFSHNSSSSIDNPPMSPLSQSLATFTPTPRMFDLLSFGRVAVRQSGRIVIGGLRGAVNGTRGAVRGVTGI